MAAIWWGWTACLGTGTSVTVTLPGPPVPLAAQDWKRPRRRVRCLIISGIFGGLAILCENPYIPARKSPGVPLANPVRSGTKQP